MQSDRMPLMQQHHKVEHRYWLSSVSLICGFGIWMFWSVASVLMLQLDFPFGPSELFSLISIAGLAGGSLRITLGFSRLLMGDRRLLPLATLLLVLLLIAIGLTLKRDTPLWVLQFLALLSGLGGGLFAAFVAEVNTLFPRSEQLDRIHFGSDLGHLGIVLSLIVLPLLAAFSGWAWVGSEVLLQVLKGSTLLGSREAGESVWIQHISYVWLLILAPVVLMLCGLQRSDWISACRAGQPLAGGTLPRLLLRTGLMLLLGLGISVLGLWLSLPPSANGGGLVLSPEWVLSLVVCATLMLLRWFSGLDGRASYQTYAIFKNKHTWIMSVLSVMSLGTFLGLSAALPLTLQLVFGYRDVVDGIPVVNINAPGIFTYAWMGPLLGILMRTFGNWMALRFGGARTTQCCAVVLFFAAVGAAYILTKAYHTPEPEQYFLPFLLMSLALFAAAGAAHAAIGHSVRRLFPAVQHTHITIWLSAVAAYGVFYIPQLLSNQLARNTPEYAMIGIALFYALCLLLNGWFYLRKRNAVFNP